MYKYKDAPMGTEMIDVDREARTVKACWSRMGVVDLDNDIIAPGAFTKTIAERGPSGKNSIWSLIDHKASLKNALGKPKELYVEGDRLIAITKVVDTEIGEDMIKLYQDGLINAHSIGFFTLKSGDQNGTRIINELMLFEGSAVLWGANPDTPTIEMMKSMDPVKAKENLNGRLERLLKGFKHGSYTDETFSLLEIEIKQIQQAIAELSTPPAAKAVEPVVPKTLLDAMKQFNNTIKS